MLKSVWSVFHVSPPPAHVVAALSACERTKSRVLSESSCLLLYLVITALSSCGQQSD